MWRDDIPALAERRRVVAYDLRGFGESPPPEKGAAYSHAADLVALLDELDVATAHVVGHSFGGQQAIEAALAAPERLASLSLVCSGLRGVPGDPVFQQMFAEVRSTARRAGVAAALPIWLANPMFDLPRRIGGEKATAVAVAAEYGGWHWCNEDPAVYDPTSPAERLADLSVPLLVVIGELDGPPAQRAAALLAGKVPGARLERIAGAGHFPNLEQPAAFRAALTAFLDERDGIGAAPAAGEEKAAR